MNDKYNPLDTVGGDNERTAWTDAKQQRTNKWGRSSDSKQEDITLCF